MKTFKYMQEMGGQKCPPFSCVENQNKNRYIYKTPVKEKTIGDIIKAPFDMLRRKDREESMSAYIEHRGKSSWRVTVSAGYVKGKQQRIRETYTFPESWSTDQQRREVERKANSLINMYTEESGSPSPAIEHEAKTDDMLFSEYAVIWLKEHASVSMQPKTLYQCELRLNRINDYLGQYRLSQIKPLLITRFKNFLSETIIDSKTNKKMAPQTVVHYMSQLSSMLSMAVKWELLDTNPCSKVTKPRVISEDICMLDEADTKRLMSELEKAPLKYQCIIYIAITAGLRLGEIDALKWQDIDFKDGMLKVNRSRSYVPGKGCFDKEPKTRTSKRSLAIPPILINKLLLLREEQKQQQERLKDKWLNEDNLFTTNNGLPMGHNTPSGWFKSFLEGIQASQTEEQTAAGIPLSEQKIIPRIKFHDLRHVHASLLIGEGVDIETVSRRLGHARASTTANIYGHPLKANDTKAAAVIESILIKE